MHIKDLYSVVVTERRAECRDFYVRWFGFRVVFEASWFVYLAATGDHPFGLAFMAPEPPSQPPGPDAFNGKGLLLTLQVEDATAEFGRLKGGGWRLPIRCTMSLEASAGSRCMIQRAPGSMSSSRSTRRRDSERSISLSRPLVLERPEQRL